MSSKSDRFKFEREGLDFPFYKDDIGWDKWGAVLIAIVAMLFTTFIKNPYELRTFLLFLIPFLAYVYLSNFKFGLIWKKLVKRDFILIIGVVFGYFIYSAIMGHILQFEGLIGHADVAVEHIYSISFWILFPFQLFGEELFRTMTFLLILAIGFKYFSRKKSVIVGLLVSSIVFGLLHYDAYGNIVQILLIQGLGISFLTYAYIKTKNILVSYIAHLIVDTVSLGLAFLIPTSVLPQFLTFLI